MLKDNTYLAFILVHAFLLLSASRSFAQFEFSSSETIQVDSTSQPERTALYFYKNYPDQYFNNEGFNTTRKYDISVFLKDGRIIDTHSQFNFSDTKHFIVSDSIKIYPENTTGIVVHFENRDYDFTGIPGDSCWYFRINDADEPIWLYSFLPEDKRRFIVFAKKKDSPYTPSLISNSLTTELIESDKIAYELLQKGRLIEAIKQYNIRNASQKTY